MVVVGSLTLNVIELFPINLFLALSLHRSLINSNFETIASSRQRNST